MTKQGWNDTMDDAAFFSQLSDEFLDRAEDELNSLLTSMNEWHKLDEQEMAPRLSHAFDRVHAMKGAAATLGIMAVEAPLKQLESMLAAALQGRLRQSTVLWQTFSGITRSLYRQVCQTERHALDFLN